MREEAETDQRTALWYMQAYRFMSRFTGYELVQMTFMEGMMTRACLHDGKVWVGPEIAVSHARNVMYVCEESRLLRLR